MIIIQIFIILMITVSFYCFIIIIFDDIKEKQEYQKNKKDNIIKEISKTINTKNKTMKKKKQVVVRVYNETGLNEVKDLMNKGWLVSTTVPMRNGIVDYILEKEVITGIIEAPDIEKDDFLKPFKPATQSDFEKWKKSFSESKTEGGKRISDIAPTTFNTTEDITNVSINNLKKEHEEKYVVVRFGDDGFISNAVSMEEALYIYDASYSAVLIKFKDMEISQSKTGK